MIAALWAKFYKWIIGIGVIAATIAAIFLKGRESGKASNQAKVDEATQDAQISTQQKTITESRHETDVETQNLPEAPAQKVADADPVTAAGRLSVWTRD